MVRQAHGLEGQQGWSVLGKEKGPAEGSMSSSMGYKAGEFKALVGGLHGMLPLPCDHVAGWSSTQRAPCQGSSQPALALFPGFDPKLFLIFFLGLLLFFCGDMLSR